MTRELHTHCQCDNCTGEDCGQDNPDEYESAREEERAAIRLDEQEKVLKICVNERKKLTFDSSFATDNAYNEGRLSIIKIIEEELRKQVIGNV